MTSSHHDSIGRDEPRSMFVVISAWVDDSPTGLKVRVTTAPVGGWPRQTSWLDTPEEVAKEVEAALERLRDRREVTGSEPA
jgi:hypothetical protein